MPADRRLRNRSRMRRKDILSLAEALRDAWGMASLPFVEETAVDEAEFDGRKVWLVDQEAVAFAHEETPAPTVRGLLKTPAAARKIVVDMGAVRFVTNGADIMGPGITNADASILEGDLVWVGEERHGKPLAIGLAMIDGAALLAKSKGKAVKNLHYLGDHLWNLGHEEPKENA